MEDFIFAPIVLVVGFAVHAALLRRHTGQEQTLLTIGFALHVAASFGQVLLTRYYFGFGDMLTYHEFAVPAGEALRSDPVFFFPAIFEAFFRTGDISAPIQFTPGGGSTLSMSALAMVVSFFTGGSLYGSVLVFGIGSYLSKVMIYWALRKDFPLPVHRYVLMGVLLLPTAAFWSSGMLKEPAVMIALGPMVLGLRWLADGQRRVLALVMIALGGTLIAMIKAYVLMVLSVAAGVYYLWMRLRVTGRLIFRPTAVITALVLGLGGFVLGNRYLIKQDNESTAASLAMQRQRGYGVEGGSNYQLDGPPEDGEGEIQDRSIAREAVLVPVALVTALFRPFLFEARNAVQLANAIECTVLLVLLVQIIRKKRWMGLIREVRSSPTLMFASIFTLALAIGTGLASTNLGTLSRYRAPMMPFFFTVLLVLRYGDEAVKKAALRKAVASQSPAPAAPRPAVAALAPRSADASRFR